VRDALSLLDQAIAHGGGSVGAEAVRRLIGLADKGRVIDLFAALMQGEAARALTEFRDQYDAGADPAVILTDLAEFTHLVTRLKIVPATAEDSALVEAERVRGQEMAGALSMRVLSRAWQMLLKGIGEVQQAAKPLQAAEMVLVRLAYVADLPSPEEALKQIRDGAPAGSAGSPAPAPSSGGAPRAMAAPAPAAAGPRLSLAGGTGLAAQPQPAAVASGEPMPASFAEVAALAGRKRDLGLKVALETQVRPVQFEVGRIEVALVQGAPAGLITDIARKLSEWTGRRWLVSVSSQPAGPTLGEQQAAARAEREAGVKAHPLVAAVLARFPGAEVVDVRTRAAPGDVPLAPEGGDPYMGHEPADDGDDFD